METVNQKKILIVTRNLPPLVGGMERLNWHIADELTKNYSVMVISHAKARVLAPKKATFYPAPLSPLPLFLIFSFIRTLLVCLLKKPDIVFAGSGLTAPIVVIAAKIFRLKSVVYIHGLDIGTNNRLYNALWIPCIRQAHKVIANSQLTYQICLAKGIPAAHLSIIHPGVSYPPQVANEKIIQQLKDQYRLWHKKILISVGRLTQRKGLNEFVQLSFSKIVAAMPNTVLIVIGNTPDQSLNKNLQSKDLILNTARQHRIENNIIFTGNINDDQILSSFYYLASMHVFPVKHIPEDPEGFGMVAIEAAAHGTPTVAFATGGIIDSVSDKISGYLVQSEDYSALTARILDLLRFDNISRSNCINFSKKFSWPNFHEKLIQAIDDKGCSE